MCYNSAIADTNASSMCSQNNTFGYLYKDISKCRQESKVFQSLRCPKNYGLFISDYGTIRLLETKLDVDETVKKSIMMGQCGTVHDFSEVTFNVCKCIDTFEQKMIEQGVCPCLMLPFCPMTIYSAVEQFDNYQQSYIVDGKCQSDKAATTAVAVNID